MKKISYEQALHKLAAYCSKAERCNYDIRKKLTAWEFPESEQEKLIQHLNKEGFLDERRFCKAFVNDKSKFNRWGTYKIKHELRQRNIPESYIKEALLLISPEDSYLQLKLILDNKRKTIKGKDEYDIRNKLIRFAAGRGFSLEEINRVLK